MRKRHFMLFLFILVISGSGCCMKKNIIVLVPDPDGITGHIVISNQAGIVEIDKPYQATFITDRESIPSEPETMEKEKITGIFSEALAIQPKAPVHFLLYFEKGSITLDTASYAVLPEIMETVTARNSTDISIVGHSDTAGDKDSNMKLSTRRAESVSRLLIEKGVRPEYIEVSSHGEENLLIKTEDNISEPRNRRVEVVVR